MNAALLEAWTRFCRGEAPTFDGDENVLLEEVASPEDLRAVLEHVPEREVIEPRLARLLGLETPPRFEGPGRYEELERTAARALLEYRRLTDEAGSKRLVKRLDALTLVWTPAKKNGRPMASSSSWNDLDGLVRDVIRTTVVGAIVGDDGKLVPSVATLVSGIYLLACDWEMVGYLLAPWLAAPYDPEPMLTLRENGLSIALVAKEARLVYPPDDAEGAANRAAIPARELPGWAAPEAKAPPAPKRTMDPSLLHAWRQFCLRPDRLGADAFYTLFMEPISPPELQEVFERVPQGDLIGPRLAQVKAPDPVVPPIDGPTRRQELEELMARDMAQKASLAEAAGQAEVATALGTPRFTWGTRQDVYAAREEASDFHAEVVSIVGDHCRAAMTEDSWLRTALTEAIYGATTDYDMVWYVLAPWLESDYDPEPAFLLREHGVMRVFTPTGVVATDLRHPPG